MLRKAQVTRWREERKVIFLCLLNKKSLIKSPRNNTEFRGSLKKIKRRACHPLSKALFLPSQEIIWDRVKRCSLNPPTKLKGSPSQVPQDCNSCCTYTMISQRATVDRAPRYWQTSQGAAPCRARACNSHLWGKARKPLDTSARLHFPLVTLSGMLVYIIFFFFQLKLWRKSKLLPWNWHNYFSLSSLIPLSI